MPVFLSTRGRLSEPVDRRCLRGRASAMLAKLELSGAELSLVLVSDRVIHELNRTYRGVDKPTDVLAFAMNEGDGLPGGTLLGDVIISVESAARQAASRRRPLLDEVTLLMAHGLLHLLGHDHAEPEEARLMRNATRRLVRAAVAAAP